VLAFRNGQHANDNIIFMLDFCGYQLHAVVPAVVTLTRPVVLAVVIA
jgi:hypothetical protein